eukprot:2182353-Prymnesium_polylepis.1
MWSCLDCHGFPDGAKTGQGRLSWCIKSCGIRQKWMQRGWGWGQKTSLPKGQMAGEGDGGLPLQQGRCGVDDENTAQTDDGKMMPVGDGS